MQSLDFLSETVSSNSAISQSIDSSSEGWLSNRNDALTQSNSAFVDSLITDLEPVETSTLMFSTSEVIDEPLVSNSSLSEDTTVTNK